MSRGFFISFEGTEGSGKSTQMRLLLERLQEHGYSVVRNQEPGGTTIGQSIRRILLDPENTELDPVAELLLMFASRAQAAAQIIRPGLERGEIVVTDRFTDSSLAYQGFGRAIGFAKVRELHQLALGSLMPDLTICLDVDLEEGLTRAHRRNTAAKGLPSEARLDSQSLEFHRCVADGYQQIAHEEPHRFLMVDGSGSIGTVAKRIWNLVSSRLPALGIAS